MSKEISVASGWEQNTAPIFEALKLAGLRPRLVREPNEAGVATCVCVPARFAERARTFAMVWNQAQIAARCGNFESCLVL